MNRIEARKRRPAPKYDFADMEKGEVFWYRSKGAIYGALVLEKLSPKHYLVVLSDALSKTPKTTDEVLNTSTYTAVWFNALLPTKRIHCIGKVLIEGDYSGRAGLYLSETWRSPRFDANQEMNYPLLSFHYLHNAPLAIF